MVIEIEDEMKAQIIEMFDVITNDVTIHVFLKEHDCLYCNDTQALADQVAELSERVRVKIHKGSEGAILMEELGVEMHPAIVLHGKEKYKIRFYGIPAGHEFSAFIAGVVLAGTGVAQLPPGIIEDIEAIDEPIHIRVFTTPQCPYCPNMVRLAHMAAVLNPLISADMIESLEFSKLAEKYEVFGVPKTIINDTVSIEGLAQPDLFVEKLFDAIDQ
ncbi:MAG: glutaredoxin [Candidatus Lokiarchaeota archaeon]|nr:glutaredoxin [Candidatus Lokiarchaeota archaeon]